MGNRIRRHVQTRTERTCEVFCPRALRLGTAAGETSARSLTACIPSSSRTSPTTHGTSPTQPIGSKVQHPRPSQPNIGYLMTTKETVTCFGITLINIALDEFPTAGRTRMCSHNWEQVTADSWVLDTVQGYRLEMESTPFQRFPPPMLNLSSQDRGLIQEIEKLVRKGAVVPVKPRQKQFLSQIFVVPKKGGTCRPVVNLKPLNKFMRRLHFKMEGVHLLKDLLQRRDWMASIDLKDAYLSVPVSPEHRPLLRFVWESQLYQFQCLPFGLSTAPRVFTKVLRPVMSLVRQHGVRTIIFLDDMLVMAQNREELRNTIQDILNLLQLTTGLHDKLGEIVSGSCPTDSVSGLHSGLCLNDHVVASREGRRHNHLLPEDVGAGGSLGKRSCQGDWSNDGSFTGGPSSTPLLSQSPTVKELSLLPKPVVRGNDYPRYTSAGGTPVVEPLPQELEWQSNPGASSTDGNRFRRFPIGLGCSLRQCEHRRALVRTGAAQAYQLLGADGRRLCHKDICEGEKGCTHTSPDGQHNRDSLCQPHGGDTFPNPVGHSRRSVAVVSTTGDHPVSRTPPGSSECDSRQGVTYAPVISRVEVARECVQKGPELVRPMSSGPVCHSSKPPTTTLCKLATRPLRHSNRCLRDEMVGLSGVCLPSLLPSGKMLTQGEGRGMHYRADSTSMAITGMVPNSAGMSGRIPSNAANF